MWEAILEFLKMLFGQRESGRIEQRHDDMEKTLERVEKANEIDDRIDNTDDAERRRLRDKWTRGD